MPGAHFGNDEMREHGILLRTFVVPGDKPILPALGGEAVQHTLS